MCLCEVCVLIGRDRDGVEVWLQVFTRVWNIESIWSSLPVFHLPLKRPDTPPCLLISKLYHIFPLAIFSARIKTLHLFSSPDQPCPTETGAESPEFNSLAQVTSWLFFKGDEPAEDKKAQDGFTDPHPRTQLRREIGMGSGEDEKMKMVEKIDKGETVVPQGTKENQKKHRNGGWQWLFLHLSTFLILYHKTKSQYERIRTTELAKPG